MTTVQAANAAAALSRAYTILLRLSPSSRATIQSDLCAIRDAIADLTGIDAEQVQSTHEMFAGATVRR